MSNEFNSNDSWELQVRRDNKVTGVLSLPAEGLLTVGRSADNDVVLRDLGLDDTTLQLRVDRPRIEISVTNGDVVFDSQPCVAGEVFVCDGSPVQVGQLSLHFTGVASRIDDSEACAESDGGKLPMSDIDHHDYEPLSSRSVDRKSTAFSALFGGSNRWVAVSIFVSLLGLLSIGSWQVYASITSEKPSPQALLEDFISDTAYSRLTLDESDNELVLRGVVRSTQERMRVEAFIRNQSINVGQSILVLEQLQAQLADIFRVNGVDATVTIDETGMLHAATSLADEKQLESVRQTVAADMPNLQDWKINNVSPPALEPPVPEDPGKRVAMVVSDEPAFVLTMDQTRYFVGSMLPTGHRISGIKDGRVFLTKGDQKSELDF